MHVITWKRLRDFAAQYPDSEKPLRAWRAVIEKSRFSKPAELKEVFANASIIGDYRTVFNIGGNKYRLIVDVRYDLGRVFVRDILTHEQYNETDVEEL